MEELLVDSVFLKKEECCGCGLCAKICTHQAIVMKADEEGFLYPQIDSTKCIMCGACQKVCSFHDLPIYQPIAYYAARHINEQELFLSSSGGVFSALAEYTIKQNGIVCGAVFDDEQNVTHTIATNMNEIRPMHGSKYVQSDIQKIYNQIEKELCAGRFVLFTGVPCQVAAIRKWVKSRKIPDGKLYTMDIVCHGTPSPKIWKDYLNAFKSQFGAYPSLLSFRNKEYGWSKHKVKVCIAEEDVTEEWTQKVDYYKLWNSQCMNRPSCYVCPYANEKRVSDFTAGDFVGIEKVKYEYPVEEGVSVLTINTSKAQHILDELPLQRIPVMQKQCVQQALDFPASAPQRRAEFWKVYHNQGLEGLIKRYGKMTLEKRIIYGIIVPLCKKMGIYHFAARLYLKRGKHGKE